MTERRTSAHRGCDEDGLRDFLVGASFLFRARDVRLDTPRALRHVRRRNCHQLFGLTRNRAVLENFLVEFHEALERVGRVLAQVAEILRGFLAVKISHGDSPWSRFDADSGTIAERPLVSITIAFGDLRDSLTLILTLSSDKLCLSKAGDNQFRL